MQARLSLYFLYSKEVVGFRILIISFIAVLYQTYTVKLPIHPQKSTSTPQLLSANITEIDT
jgi:uncharacterized protein (UPF0305 family)